MNKTSHCERSIVPTILFPIWCFILCAISVDAQTTTVLYQNAPMREMQQWVDSVYAGMSLEQKIGQLIMPVVSSAPDWSKKIGGYIRNKKVGGLLFSKGTLVQQAECTNQAQALSDIPLMIALDGEWGLSMRLSDAPLYPRNGIVGAISDEEVLKLYGREVARQCKAMGIHVNFAPCLDVHSNPLNPVIATRSYGENPNRVAASGIAFAKGMEEGGVMAVAKHFPGHGDTSEDSHTSLPIIMHDRQRLDTVELLPFRAYIEAGLSGIMIGHLNIPTLQTNGRAATLSPYIGNELLKKELGFTGLTFTDAMSMKAVSESPDAGVEALLAGSDILLAPLSVKETFNSVKRAVAQGTIPEALLEEKIRKILSYKFLLGVDKFTPIATSSLSGQVNAPRAEWIQRKIYDNAVTLLKNDSALVPLKELDKHRIASLSIAAPPKESFRRYLQKYGDVTAFHAASAAQLPDSLQLRDFDLIICSLYSGGGSDLSAFQRLSHGKRSVLVLFTPPEKISMPHNLEAFSAVILAYDSSDFAQTSAAQAIFGGIDTRGRIPVSVGPYPEGSGINTKKIRLGYALPEEVGIPSEKLQPIETIVAEGIRQRAFPGCQVLVAKEGIIIYERAFGFFDYGKSTPVTDTTVYDLASVTKASATLPAVMKLYDEKKIRLQDPIRKFVPETKGSDKADITLRSLLFHESGIVPFIPYYTTAIDSTSYTGSLFGRKSDIYRVRYAGAWARTDYKFLPELISVKKTEAYNSPVAQGLYAGKAMHDALLKDVIASPLRRKGKYRYSCLNFMLLKEAVENISGSDLNSYLKQHFYCKLGAVTTTFLPLQTLSIDRIPPTENDPFFRKQLIRGYVHDEGAALFGGISGNAGLFSSAGDLAKLYQMWLNGGEYGGERLLGKETVKLFTTMKSSISRRGLGFDKPDSQSRRNSPTAPGAPIEVFGHGGFTGTCFWVDPLHNMIYIFLSNRVYPDRYPDKLSSLDIRTRIQEELYRALETEKTE